MDTRTLIAIIVSFLDGITTIASASLGIIAILESAVGSYYIFGFLGMISAPTLAFIFIIQSRNKPISKIFLLCYLIGILIGIAFVNVHIFHTPCALETC